MYCFRYACTGLRCIAKGSQLFTHPFERFLVECSKQNKRNPSPPSSEDNSRQKLPDSSATSCFIALNKLYYYIGPFYITQVFFKYFFRIFSTELILYPLHFKPFQAGILYTVSRVSQSGFQLIFRKQNFFGFSINFKVLSCNFFMDFSIFVFFRLKTSPLLRKFSRKRTIFFRKIFVKLLQFVLFVFGLYSKKYNYSPVRFL